MKRLFSFALGIILVLSNAFARQKEYTDSLLSVNTVVTNDQKDEVQDDGPIRSKSFSKTFSINKNDHIDLSNKFGQIIIKTWDRNEVKADVDIKAYSNSAEDAQRLLDEVSVAGTKNGNQVSFKTTINDIAGGWNKGKKWKREIKINYVVYLPVYSTLSISHQYGNVVMTNFSGSLSAAIQYGDFTATDLSGTSNAITIQYGSSKIASINKGIIKHQYGPGITIGTVNDLEMNTQYTSVNIGKISNSGAQVQQQYGDLNIGSAEGISVNTKYTGVSIGALNGNGKFNIQYNNLKINTVTNGSNLDISGKYADISAGFAKDFNGNFRVNTQYGSFNYGSNVTITQQSNTNRSSTSKNHEGKIGAGGGTNSVNVTSQYGSVNFK